MRFTGKCLEKPCKLLVLTKGKCILGDSVNENHLDAGQNTPT